VAHGGSISTARLYTRTGDDGSTGLYGGTRVGKDSLRLRAYGAYDELGAHLGVAAGLLGNQPELREILVRLQHELFLAMSEMAAAPGFAPKTRIEARHTTGLEALLDRFDAELPPLQTFVLPGGTPGGAQLHVARTVSRRAERELIALHRTEPIRPELLAWANRLSDLLFALALTENHRAGIAELAPNYQV